jgi:hypothetical protein
MKKDIPLYIYCAIIIFEGVFLLFSKDGTFETIKYTTGITLIIGAIFGFFTALSRQRKQVAFSYHETHALAMLVYGISVLLFSNTFESLTSFSAYLFFFYAFSEIIFSNWLFNLENKVVYKTVLIRIFLGTIVGVGTIVIMYYYNTLALQGFGILFIIIGINFLLYIPIMKRHGLKEVEK